MKNRILTQSILVIVSILYGTFSARAAESYRLPEPTNRTHHHVRYRVDPGIELMAIVQTISEYPEGFPFLMQQDSCRYKQEVLETFGRFTTHPAVLWLNRQCRRRMNFNAPPYIMLYADQHLELRSDLDFDEFVVSRAGGRDSLVAFLGLLRDFALQSSFNEFFVRHREFYGDIISRTIAEVDSIDHILELEAFYGTKQKSYSIVLVSLYNHVGFGNSIVYRSGEREIFDTMGPRGVRGDEPHFGDAEYLNYLTRHEFSHPFINPLTEKYWDAIKAYEANYEAIPETAKKNVCGSWQECINESMIRAIGVLLAEHENPALGELVASKERARGITYLDPLLVALREYEKNRQAYPTFDSYYLRVLEVFKK
ncbi:MAG TPA: DUF4932 domain-containing protein [Bacteroidota bacterium]|nr:DUF4932 domain-containing protein [Bacteroidota bacterium]